MRVITSIRLPKGKGPQQGPIHNQGSKYIEENFPELDKFNTCTVKRVKEIPKPGSNSDESKSAGNVRKAGIKEAGGAASDNVIDVKMEKQPMIKLAVMIGGAVVVILLLGLRGRKKRKIDKSV